MKVLKVTCRGGRIFYYKDNEQLRTFVNNYPLPDVRVGEEEMTEEEYRDHCANKEWEKYFKED